MPMKGERGMEIGEESEWNKACERGGGKVIYKSCKRGRGILFECVRTGEQNPRLNGMTPKVFYHSSDKLPDCLQNSLYLSHSVSHCSGDGC